MSIYNENNIIIIVIRKLYFLRIFKHPLLIFIIYGALNYSGFCFEDMRYISDDEKIRQAIYDNYIVKNNINYWFPFHYVSEIKSNQKQNTVDKYKKIIPYDNVEAFLRENPNCCVINKGYGDDAPPSFWEQVFGICNYGISISYTEKYIEKSLKEPIEQYVNNWEKKQEEALKKVEGQERKRFIENDLFIAGNCGKFCRSD